ncbi:hypothetical protein [Streptomyces flaveolus]|uniref:hypothetical protein n=1 Tax=Streptomyces flaveolus TaxID=67297 RepID=UPI00166FC94A|nr:hypothetical protein [Streptomyces flaveolus]GGQ93929.1 hypothetical protein GCM10010216_65390 [Streptomyces flaveolus]
MTQSGQGEEPSPRQAREGIVLPSDGGAPLLPGLAGGPAGPEAARPAPASAPPGAQAWDQPWGPGQQYGPTQGESWPTPPGAQPWGSPDSGRSSAEQHGWPAQGPAQGPGGLPPEAGPGPLPPENTQPPAYGGPVAAGHAQGAQSPYGQPEYGQPAYGQPEYGQHGQPSVPLPPADEGATQYLPPVGIPADEGATQYIPPVSPGALPPERPAGTPSDATQFLGHAPQHAPYPAGHQPAPAAPHPDAEATQYIAPVPAGPHGGMPGADDGRQPPAEFDSLFRSAPGADGPASATQQMPRFDEPGPAHSADPSGYVPQGPGGGGRRRGGHDDAGRGGRGGRTGSRVPLLAAVGVGIVVVGIGAGAMMAGGGGDDDKADNQTVSATAPADSASASASPSADPVRQQAVELDKLLAQSGSSRTTVINAVADVKSCDNLPQAAKDLREAAKQRTGLVTSLSRLSVDKLPGHAELTAALTEAWQASASADNHYAAWADQTAGKKGCKKGKARSTAETQAGNRASGTASAEKAKAADLWNTIAKQYGLTEREPTQL